MANNFDGTFFEADDAQPFFGEAEEILEDAFADPTHPTGVVVGYGDLIEADFSTDPTHPRPFLREVKNWSATEIDFPEGASTIGGLNIDIVDVPQDPTDQRSGLLTSRLGEIVGRRFLLRREHPSLGMITAFDGVVQGYKMGGQSEGLVVVTITIKDFRERERKQSLFTSNFVLYGKDGAQGSPINYGALPSRKFAALLGAPQKYLLNKVAPFETSSAPFQHHYQSLGGFGDGQGGPLAWSGMIGAPNSSNPFNLGGDIGMPTQDADGVYYYRGFQVWWRLAGETDDDWRKIKNMPRRTLTIGGFETPGGQHAVSYSTGLLGTFISLYMASYDQDLQPPQGQPLEILIVANDITEDTPFFWDGGSHGQLLKEIYDGEHSLDATRIRYNPEAMDEFIEQTPPARMILTEPVDDMREWVEKNLYAPMGYAPAFDQEKRVMPVPWAFPKDEQDYIPLIEATEIVPIGDWEHTDDTVINAVDFTYLRESIAAQEVTKEKKTKKFLGFIPYGSKTVSHVGELSEWDRYFTREVERPRVDIDSVSTFGTKKIALTPIALRAIGDVTGAPSTGDAQDELGTVWADRLTADITRRFRYGAVKFKAMCLRSSVVQDLHEGSWVRIDVPYMPSYARARRGTRRFMQVYAISDEDPIQRELLLVDSGIPDLSEDEDTVDPIAGGCIAASEVAVPVSTPIRQAGYYFTKDGEITNNCAQDIILPAVLLVAGGGAGGLGSSVGGGGGAGGVLILKNVRIAANQTIPITVGVGGEPTMSTGESGGDTVLWAHQVTGMALDPLTDNPDLGWRAKGGGGGGAGSGAGGDGGGSGGGSGASLPISGGGSHFRGQGEPPQGHDGGNGNDAGGIATCAGAAGGGGGSYFGLGEAGFPGVRGGFGGPSGRLKAWGVRLGGGGQGGVAAQAGALGEEICGPDFHDAGDVNIGIGMGGGGGAFGAGSPGVAGVAIIAYKGLRPPVLDPPDITSTEVTADGQVRVCIKEDDWPVLAADDYRVRIEYAVSDTPPTEATDATLFSDALNRDQPYASGGYTPSDVSPLSLHTGFDFPQPATVHRELGDKWEEMFSTRWDIDGGQYGSQLRSAPGGRIPGDSNLTAYTAAGGTLPGGIPAGFKGGLIRPVVSLSSSGYVFEVAMTGSSESAGVLLALFNFDPTTGNGYAVDFGDEGHPRNMRKITGWVVPLTGIGLNFGFEPGDTPWGAGRKLRITTRPGEQSFEQVGGPGRAVRNDTDYDPSNGGIYIWVNDGRWNESSYPQANALYMLSSLRVFEEGADLAGGDAPSESSPEWKLAGYLEAPGCVITSSVPTGSVVVTRAVAEAPEYPPSATATPDHTEQVPATPDFLEVGVDIQADGSVLAHWVRNAFNTAVRLRAKVHAAADDASPPLDTVVPYINADEQQVVLPGLTVLPDKYVTVDFEAWEELQLPTNYPPLVVDDFNRGNDDNPGPLWEEVDTAEWQVNANTLEIGAFSQHFIKNPAVDLDEMFVQVALPFGTENETGVMAKFRRLGSSNRNSYMLLAAANFPAKWQLVKQVADTITMLDEVLEPDGAAAGGNVQLYVKNGVQEAHANGHDLSAADTTFDNLGGASGLYYAHDSSETSMRYDDFLAFTSKYLTIMDVPVGYKVKVLNSDGDVVAEGTSVSGTVTVDCSVFGGAAETVPMAGWPATIVTDGADVELARYDRTATYPGMEMAYSDPMQFLDGPIAGPGKVRRVTEYRPVDEVATPTDVAETISGSIDAFTFDDELNLTLDDDLNPVLDN